MDERSAEKPTEEWVTGDEPMTGPQRSYLHTLAREAGEEVPDDLTKAHASEMIERLQHTTGRGEQDHNQKHNNNPNAGSLGERVEQAGIVDQQAMLVDDISAEQSEAS